MSRPSWANDGRSIVFTANRTGSLPQVWRVDAESGQLEIVAGLGQVSGYLSVWGDRLIFVQWQQYNRDIRRVAVGADRDSEPETLIGSAYGEWNADISPDGSQIVFESVRSGFNSVWKSGIDGSSPVQLTDFEEWAGTPRWSSDGRMIAFDSLHSGDWDLWLVEAEGGVPRQLTAASSDENIPAWSRDGRWIYFSSTRTGKREIFKIPCEGGEAIQFTKNGGLSARESGDGQYVYYTKLTELGLWRLPRSGDGEEEKVLPGIRSGDFEIGKQGIYFSRHAPQDFRISFLSFGTGETTQLYRRSGPFEHTHQLNVSPDEKWLLFSESPMATSELMLVQNFH